MTHTLWGEIVRKQVPDPLVLDQQIHYVKGYILALGDVLSDLDASISSNARSRIEESLRSARRTLAVLVNLADGTEPLRGVGNEDGTAGG